jgi:hypothetical protein
MLVFLCRNQWAAQLRYVCKGKGTEQPERLFGILGGGWVGV